MNVRQVVAVAMDTERAAEAAINEGRVAVVERVAAAMMQGRPAAREEEREVFLRNDRHSIIENITCNIRSNYQ